MLKSLRRWSVKKDSVVKFGKYCTLSLSLYYIHDAIFYLRLCLYGFDLVYLWLSWAETSSLPLQSCCKVTGTFYLT